MADTYVLYVTLSKLQPDSPVIAVSRGLKLALEGPVEDRGKKRV